MDPNTTLTQLRSLAAHINDDERPEILKQNIDLTEEAIGMANLFQALDDWLTHGGFLPIGWLEPITRDGEES